MALPLALALSAPSLLAEEPRPAITLRLDGPERQLRAVIDLFRGARAPHPAAALSAWKRASQEPGRLGKPLEALIAAINPSMAGELRALDGAEIALWIDREGGRPAWGATLPGDDGTFAALATAFVLTGGVAEEPMEGLAVDRLGPPGSALMARGPKGLLVAGSPGGLKEARIRSDRPRPSVAGDRLRLEVDPQALEGSNSLAIRRLKVALEAAGGRLSGSSGLEGTKLVANLSFGGTRPESTPAVDPKWLDWLPTDRAAFLFALAIDPSPSNWQEAFRLADRIEKADPTRVDVAPLRLRLDLLARTQGVRVDPDLFPHLKGVAGWVGSDGQAIDRAFVMLQLDDEAAASRIYDRARPLPGSGSSKSAGPGRELGRVEGRAIRLFRFGSAVVASWGEGVLETSLQAREHPERSARSLFLDPRPAFLGAAWPARVSGWLPPEPPLSLAIAGAPPVLCSGVWKGTDVFQLEGAWDKLDGTIRRFLDLIPLDPPPDR